MTGSWCHSERAKRVEESQSASRLRSLGGRGGAQRTHLRDRGTDNDGATRIETEANHGLDRQFPPSSSLPARPGIEAGTRTGKPPSPATTTGLRYCVFVSTLMTPYA